MTGEKLWQSFAAGTYPKDDFIGLGKALFFGKGYGKVDPGPKKIVGEVAARVGVSPETLYASMNRAPLGGMTSARKLLGGFGADVTSKKPWQNTQATTRKLIETVASALGGPVPSAQPASSTRAAPARPSQVPAAEPQDHDQEIDFQSIPIFKLYREAVQMGDDDEPLVREAKRMNSALKAAGAQLEAKTLELENKSEKLRRANRVTCEMTIAEVALAIKQGRASREAVESAKRMAEDCGMAKTAVELDRLAREMPRKSGGAGKFLIGAVVVAAAAGGAYAYSQQKDRPSKK